MTLRTLLRRLRRDRRGVEALEFVITSAVFFTVSFAIIEAGLALWTQNAMQTAATLSARCAAIGSAACPDVASYAVTALSNWVVPDTFSTADVSVSTGASCNAAPGKAVIVTISHKFWSNIVLPPPFSSPTIQVSACFPSSS